MLFRSIPLTEFALTDQTTVSGYELGQVDGAITLKFYNIPRIDPKIVKVMSEEMLTVFFVSES